MHTIKLTEANVKWMGRTFTDSERGIIWFNFTCAGFEFKFTGSKVDAKLYTNIKYNGRPAGEAYVAVYIDGQAKPYRRFPLSSDIEIYNLFESEAVGTHTLRLLKLTEASSNAVGAGELLIEGEEGIEPTPAAAHRIEFIGDSITCGYGILAPDATHTFSTATEDGSLAYAARAAMAAGADFSCVSVSGIGLLSGYTGEDRINDGFVMQNVYPFTDKFYERRYTGRSTQWDSERFKPDIIVINLGTNDHSYAMYDMPVRLPQYGQRYIDFIADVRRRNPDSYILCAFGMMGQEMYPEIERRAQEFSRVNGDSRIGTLLMAAQNPKANGIGADSHPSLKSHDIATAELSVKLIEILSAKGTAL